jgi:hypothetical protein
MSHVRLDYIPVVSNSVVNGHATHVQLDYILEVSHSVVNDHATSPPPPDTFVSNAMQQASHKDSKKIRNAKREKKQTIH